ncbi:transcription factor domain-containing protein [Aspergillus lucknowensis]|uniref:Zn(2)-C6 fungal-type domain-containing protein n=1 Tax=Aspergillus lucknowensis TaxID=176173 RepID=A0ABR4LIS7_9EURO
MLNACIICHKKKVKCNLARQHPCSNCTKGGWECVPYQRKRKLYTNSLSPPESRAPSRERRAPSPAGAYQIPRPCNAPPPEEHGAVPTYRGRDRYLGRNASFDEAIITPSPTNNPQLSSADHQLLKDQGAFTLPSERVQSELITTFMEYGHVWTPVIDPSWLSGDQTSYLLLQAIFLAASRMTPRPNEYGQTSEFYRRAKLLFFFGNEPDPLVSVVSAVLLHWYNPVGPETVSTDTSGFWLRTAESIAFQIGLHKEPAATDPQRGLRRRIWWTLVLRDCIISAGVGRPRTINLSDSDVLPPSIDDFPEQDVQARTFPVYVSICQLLGNIVERCLRRELFPEHQRSLENSLFRWAKQDFHTISGPSLSYSLETRQVLVTYFANLIILERPVGSDGPLAARSLLCASFIVGIYRDFLARDELCRLGPAFTFYALCAGLVLIPAYRIEALWETANEETIILKASLQILSKQWGSAFGALRALQKLSEDPPRQEIATDEQIPRLSDETRPFFEGFNTRWCRLWGPIVERTHERTASVHGSLRSILDEYASSRPWGNVPHPGLISEPLDAMSGDWEGVGFDWGGSWLLDSSL